MGASSSILQHEKEEEYVFDLYKVYKSPKAYDIYKEYLQQIQTYETKEDQWRRMCSISAHH